MTLAGNFCKSVPIPEASDEDNAVAKYRMPSRGMLSPSFLNEILKLSFHFDSQGHFDYHSITINAIDL
jgi:hypothetical protein